MTQWRAVKAKRLLGALLRIGWSVKRQSGGSHRVLARSGWSDFVFAFHDQVEIGPNTDSRFKLRVASIAYLLHSNRLRISGRECSNENAYKMLARISKHAGLKPEDL